MLSLVQCHCPLDDPTVSQWSMVMGRPVSCVSSSKFCDHQLLQQYNELVAQGQVRGMSELVVLIYCSCKCSVDVLNNKRKSHRDGFTCSTTCGLYCGLHKSKNSSCIYFANQYVVPAHQTSDMSHCSISPESLSKLEMVILSSLRFLTI